MSSQHDAALVLRRFVDANARQDEEGMKACLTRATLEGGGFSGPTPPGVVFRMGEGEEDADGTVIIPLRVVPADAGPDGPILDELRCRMVQEDGEWKFDLAGTMESKFAGLDEAMKQVGEAMGEALSGLGEAIGEALGSAFGQSGNGEAEMTSPFTYEPLEFSTFEDAPEMPTEAEWVDLPEFTTLERQTSEVSEVCGRRVAVVCDLGGLLGLFGSDDGATLVPWLDAEFCPGLASAIQVATQAVPKEALRLRRVRIEAALEWMQRGLFLDGPDLVYRADLRDPQGWYSGDELAQIIMGVIAGMAEDAERYPVDRGIVPRTVDRDATESLVALYRGTTAPREMRRLSRRLGGAMALDVEWSMMQANDTGARNLWCWMLNRVVGAVGMAYPAECGESPAPGWLRVVRIAAGFGEKRASRGESVLEMSISPMGGEAGCFYEHELCRVLLGEEIGGESAGG